MVLDSAVTVPRGHRYRHNILPAGGPGKRHNRAKSSTHTHGPGISGAMSFRHRTADARYNFNNARPSGRGSVAAELTAGNGPATITKQCARHKPDHLSLTARQRRLDPGRACPHAGDHTCRTRLANKPPRSGQRTRIRPATLAAQLASAVLYITALPGSSIRTASTTPFAKRRRNHRIRMLVISSKHEVRRLVTLAAAYTCHLPCTAHEKP